MRNGGAAGRSYFGDGIPPTFLPVPGGTTLPLLLKAAILTCLALDSAGCQTGRHWSRTDSDSRTPVTGMELQTDQPAPPPQQPIADAAAPSSRVETTSLPQQSDSRSRKLIPDWLRLGKEDEPVPLPTTQPLGPADPVVSAAGPVEEFQ